MLVHLVSDNLTGSDAFLDKDGAAVGWSKMARPFAELSRFGKIKLHGQALQCYLYPEEESFIALAAMKYLKREMQGQPQTGRSLDLVDPPGAPVAPMDEGDTLLNPFSGKTSSTPYDQTEHNFFHSHLEMTKYYVTRDNLAGKADKVDFAFIFWYADAVQPPREEPPSPQAAANAGDEGGLFTWDEGLEDSLLDRVVV